MALTRRSLIRAGAAACAGLGAGLGAAPALVRAAKARGARFRVGVTDWNLKLRTQVEAVALAKKIGFDGVQVAMGRKAVDGKLPLADPAMQAAYLDASKRHALPVASLCLDILHVNGLKVDPLGARWVSDAIPIARAMGVRVVLLPFFGKQAIETDAEQDRVADILKEIGPDAGKAGVVLGIENTISARANARIMDRSKSTAVKTYYDVGNSTAGGFDIAQEIRWLGRERICEVHLKDNPNFLGQGKIDFARVLDALHAIGFDAWAHLETDTPTKDVEADQGRNLAFVRDLLVRGLAAPPAAGARGKKT